VGGVVIRRFVRDDGGAAVVEFAFVLPVFLVLIAGLYDGARFLTGELQVHAAAQAGAAWAASHGWDADGITNAVARGAPIAASATPAPVLTQACADHNALVAPDKKGHCPGGEPVGEFVAVNAQARFTPMAPGFGGVWPAMINARATVRIP
jgi:Flp pilus assembly pilin Flp